jgi:hypothetical protein
MIAPFAGSPPPTVPARGGFPPNSKEDYAGFDNYSPDRHNEGVAHKPARCSTAEKLKPFRVSAVFLLALLPSNFFVDVN